MARRRALSTLARDAQARAPSPSLIRACVSRLGDRDREVHRFALETLSCWLENGEAGPRREVARRLKDALRRRNPRAAWSAAFVLTRAPGPRAELVGPLLRAFALDDADDRWTAAQALVRIAHAHAPTARRVRALARRGSPMERRMALYCLRDLSKRATDALDLFLHALRDADPFVRSAAASILGQRGDRRRCVLDGLLDTLRSDPSLLVRRVAAVSLGQIGAARSDVRECLESALEGDDLDLRKAARHALAHLSPGRRLRREPSDLSQARRQGSRRTRTEGVDPLR
jgi:HEAT repeat protein